MARLAAFFAAGLSVWLSVASALAQTGPMAPGADILPEKWRKSAEAPLVLTAAVSAKLCLDMSDQDKQAKTVQMWACTPRWNQKVWVEPLAASGGDKVRIRIGNLACLLDGGRQGARATMGICNDTPAAEPWTARGGQLIGASGLCLDAQAAAADGAPVVSFPCSADAKGQQWRLEAMRAALSRGPPDRFDPSGFGEYFYSGYVPDTVEQFRPRFTARKLTSAERAEIKSLTAPWRKFKALDGLLAAMGSDNKVPPVAIPWSTLRRLSELGESGDKEAMRAAMEAFALVRDTNWADTFAGWDETAFPHANDSRLAHGVAKTLANLWSAHYWQKHGPDRVAAYAFAYTFANCDIVRASHCAGYTAKVDHPKRDSNILKWAQTGDSKFEVAVSDITFHPAGGTYEQRQARFVSVLNGTAFMTVSDRQGFSIDERAANAVFAAQTGRLALWDNVMLNTSFDYPMFTSHQEGYMRTALKARADAADWRAKFEAFMAAPDDARAWSIQQGLLTASDADMLRFAERHVVRDSELSERLCGSGRQATPACQKSRQAIAERRAEFDRYIEQARVKREAEQAAQFAAQQAQEARDEQERRRFAAMNPPRQPDFWDQLAGLAEGFAAAAEAGNQQVEVRKYDSQGNFIGTESMSRARAMGLGAQTPN